MSDEQMAAWMKYAQPGEGHRFLEKLTGTWNASAKFWMKPGEPPMESTGTIVNEMVLEGRFLKSQYTSEFAGAPFQGLALDGFDNQKQKFVGMWIDSMSTAMFVFEGTCDEDAKVRTMIAEYVDPATGQPAKMKGVTTWVGKDEHRYESWNTGPEGEYVKTMEAVYRRK